MREDLPCLMMSEVSEHRGWGAVKESSSLHDNSGSREVDHPCQLAFSLSPLLHLGPQIIG